MEHMKFLSRNSLGFLDAHEIEDKHTLTMKGIRAVEMNDYTTVDSQDKVFDISNGKSIRNEQNMQTSTANLSRMSHYEVFEMRARYSPFTVSMP